MPAVRMSNQMPAMVPQSGLHNAPPGTIELVAPPSAILALETAPIRIVRPEDARDGRGNRSWLIIVVTVLAVVGIGIGAMAALSGGNKKTAPAAAGPSVTPIDESTQPAVTQPAVTQPTVTQPAVTQPAVTQPVKQPTVKEPTVKVKEPTVEEPTVKQPSTTPGTTKPPTKKDKIKKPPSGCTDPLECMN
jgi:hypothetical protein